MAKVYFIRAKDINKKLPVLFDALAFDFKNQKVGIKLHFGEKGNKTFVKPGYVKVIADQIRKHNGSPDLIECCVLYRSVRTRADTHIELAKQHGFDFAPIVICDGELGDEFIEVSVKKKHFKKIKVGAKLKDYPFIVGIAHFKAHGGTGFAGALKNIGMGLGSRAGKLDMHSKTRPVIDTNKCTACSTCAANCPVNAITVMKHAMINEKLCIGCAKCIAVCPEKAVHVPWGSTSESELQERIVEYAYGILKNIKSVHFSFLTDITPHCDCCSHSDTPVCEDIGVLASDDIIALDQASYDLVCRAKTNTKSCLKKQVDDKFSAITGIDSSVQLKYGEKIGLGKREYELVEL